MRSTRSSTGPLAGRRLGLTAWGVLTAFLVTGCVGLPADGSPERVEMSQGAGGDNLQVRVFPVAPYKGETPDELLSGFLAASNADEENYDTARQYLTPEVHDRWDPNARVVVLSSTIRRAGAIPTSDDTRAEITLSGDKIAELDAKHTYRPAGGSSFQQPITFVKEADGPSKGEWRISSLPDGLIVDQTTFKNNYRAAHRYFFAAPDPSGNRVPSGQVMVPDPIYLRRRIDPLTAAARALAAGPSTWLAPAVSTAFEGVNVLGAVTVNDSRVATVRIDAPDLTGRQQLCLSMAQQLYQTFADQQGRAQIDRLDLSGQKGSCSLGSSQAAAVAPGALAGVAATQQYYQLDTGQLMQVSMLETVGRPVPGPLGRPGVFGPNRPDVVEVSRDASSAAAVTSDGKALYLIGTTETDQLAGPVVSSRAPVVDGVVAGLGSPSWDGRGDLWLVDRDPAAPRVLAVRGKRALPVTVDDLGTYTVQTLRISSDGVRVALVVKDRSNKVRVMLGLVIHGGTPDQPTARISGLRPIAAELEKVASISWADSDQLLVLGTESGKLQQLHYLGTDGSQSIESPQQGGESMTAVSATEGRQVQGDQLPPVLAISNDHHIYRLQGNQWRELGIGRTAVSFSYPS